MVAERAIKPSPCRDHKKRSWRKPTPGARSSSMLSTRGDTVRNKRIFVLGDNQNQQHRHQFASATLSPSGETATLGNELHACVRSVTTPDELNSLANHLSSHSLHADFDALLVDMRNDASWKVIPAENLRAAMDSSLNHSAKAEIAAFEVLALVRSCDDALRALNALEAGLDGVVLDPNSPNEVFNLRSVIDQAEEQHSDRLALEDAEITSVQRIGEGERACIDLASAMNPGEGALVGCFAQGQLLVHAECFESGFVCAREWRVNAGVLSAYIACPEGHLPYLSELRCGSSVLVIGADGAYTSQTVARVKVERRTLSLIEARTVRDGTRIAVMVQEAETVRIARPGLQPVSPFELEPGSKVLAYTGAGGPRHTGVSVSEATFSER